MVIPQLSKLKPGVRFPLPAHMEHINPKGLFVFCEEDADEEEPGADNDD